MLYAHTPDECQRVFCDQVGLVQTVDAEGFARWSGSAGSMLSFGSMDTVQVGSGDYVIPRDVVIGYAYGSSYLHFGIIRQGVTATVVEDQERVQATASEFVGINRLPAGVNRWHASQRFRDVEVSADLAHLSTMLPVIGLEPSCLDFLGSTTLSVGMPPELCAIVERLEESLLSRRITRPALAAMLLEFVAILVEPQNASSLTTVANKATTIRVGSRAITISPEESDRIAAARTVLGQKACEFPTVGALSRELGIGEQKLKAGFAHRYGQTIWEYANDVRMTQAVKLLRSTSMAVSDIAHAVGYQSVAGFSNMFKQWSGSTPMSFRAQVDAQADTQVDAQADARAV